MKANIYTTIENQIRADGSRGVLYDHYTDRAQAESKYHTILAAAAVSDVPYHEALLFDCNGEISVRTAYDRRPDIGPEPTPEEAQYE